MKLFAPQSVIFLVDIDAFFPQVEQILRPALRGRPVIVGGLPERRGVVSAASYEARKFGVHSAMPTATALRLCPQAVVRPVRMERYVEVSRGIREILISYTPMVEPISIDEAFLDVTGSRRLLGEPIDIARAIKKTIRDENGDPVPYLQVQYGPRGLRAIARVKRALDPHGILNVGNMVPAEMLG